MSDARRFDVWNRAHVRAEIENKSPGEQQAAWQQAQALTESCLDAGLSWQELEAAEEVLRLRPQIAAGDGGAVLEALAHCVAAELVAPPWLAEEFLRRHGAVCRGFARDWNDAHAFGSAYPKGTNIAGIRAKANYAGPAYRIAGELLAADPAQAVDATLFDAVARRVGVGRTRVKELIDWFVAEHGAAPLAELRKRLRAGRTLEQAERDWRDEQFYKRWPDTGPANIGK